MNDIATNLCTKDTLISYQVEGLGHSVHHGADKEMRQGDWWAVGVLTSSKAFLTETVYDITRLVLHNAPHNVTTLGAQEFKL